MSNSEEPKSGTAPFRPRARLVSVLGDQLIRDATIGIIELVKNGYDADADCVTVELNHLSDPARTTIVLSDNGIGMTLDTVLSKWLEPASGHKEAQKKANNPSARGRLPLGEKGVGRFAAHKLGKRLVLATRAVNEPDEVYLEVDWSKFDQENAYLENIPMKWELHEPVFFNNNKTGTRLEMIGARAKWAEPDVAKVSRNLKRLMSPFKTPEAFKVELKCPEFPKYEELDPGDILKQAHATFIAVVDEEGKIEYDYEFKLPGYEKRNSSIKSDDDAADLRLPDKRWGIPPRKPTCGPFYLNFYLWDRRPDSLRISGTSRTELDEACGISIFRDGIRVLPYGEPNDDWLELDKRRYMETSAAVSRKNIIGAIEISQIANPDLRDKTNREGLLENEAYDDLIKLLNGVIKWLENEFSSDRKKLDAGKKPPSADLRPSFKKLDSSVKALAQVNEPLKESAQKLADMVKEGQQIVPRHIEQLAEFVNQAASALAEVEVAQQTAERAVEDSIEEFANERDLLLGLAGTGLAAERFTHEFARLTREAGEALERLRKKVTQKVPEATTDLNALGAVIDALKNDIRALGPIFYVRRTTREKELNIKTVIENACLLNASQIKDNKIEVEIEEITPLLIVMREGPCTQVFNNLIDNACYWLSRKSDEENRALRIVINGAERTILLSNNGPGVFNKFRHRLFEPFFTTKPEGRGLGLFITQEILSEKKGTITLIENEDYPRAFRKGVSFLIRFIDKDEKNGG